MIKKILLGFIVLSVIVFAKEVTVSISAQKYFVEKIVADKIKVNVMVKPGASPATYEPKVSQMRKLANSDIYFSIGVPFENVWLDKFKMANKNMIVVDTSYGVEKQEMEEHKHHDEQDENEAKHDEHAEHDEHEEEHDEHEAEHAEHNHKGLDPHIWLDPILVKIQAKNIYEAIINIDAENKNFYKTNYENFLIELDNLNKELKSILEPYEHKAFMVFHPSWGYFAKRYELEQIAIEVQGKEPKPSQLVELVHEAKKHGIKIVFVSPQFSKKGAKTISNTINGNVEVINPLSYDWDINLLKTAKEIAKSYK